MPRKAKPPEKMLGSALELAIHRATVDTLSRCTRYQMTPEDTKMFLECVIERLQLAVEEMENG